MLKNNKKWFFLIFQLLILCQGLNANTVYQKQDSYIPGTEFVSVTDMTFNITLNAGNFSLLADNSGFIGDPVASTANVDISMDFKTNNTEFTKNYNLFVDALGHSWLDFSLNESYIVAVTITASPSVSGFITSSDYKADYESKIIIYTSYAYAALNSNNSVVNNFGTALDSLVSLLELIIVVIGIGLAIVFVFEMRSRKNYKENQKTNFQKNIDPSSLNSVDKLFPIGSNLRFCHNCGQEINNNQKFCPNCGIEI